MMFVQAPITGGNILILLAPIWNIDRRRSSSTTRQIPHMPKFGGAMLAMHSGNDPLCGSVLLWTRASLSFVLSW
jgi:hypothetical protein